MNAGDITTNALSVSPSVTVAFTASGVSAAVSTSNADAVTNGIRGGQGDDTIANDGTINTHADSVAATLNVSVASSGAAVAADAVWDGGTRADSTAIGIAGDGGDLSTTTRLAVGTDELSRQVYLKDMGIETKRDYVDPRDVICRYTDATTSRPCVIVAFSMKSG